MNTRSTITVVLIALALGVYFLVFETDLFDSQLLTTRQIEERLAEQGPSVGQPLPVTDPLAIEEVRRIRMELGDRPAVEIERTGGESGQWVQTHPVRFPLEAAQVRELVDAAIGLRHTTVIQPGEQGLSLEEMGLNPPRAVITFEGEDAGPLTLRLGRRTGVGRAYLAMGGSGDPGEPGDAGEFGETSTVYVVGDALHQAVLDARPSELRSTSLASIPPGSAERIRLTRDGETIELVRQDGRWMLTAPVSGRADTAAAQAIVSAIGSTTIDEFVEDNPENLAAFALDDPSIVLNIQTVEAVGSATDDGEDDQTQGGESSGGLTTYELRIGGPTNLEQSSYFAMFNEVPIVFTLPQAAVARLEKQVDDLREASVTPIARSDVQGITIERADAPPLHFLRDQGVWVFGEPAPGFNLGTAAIETLLDAIFEARAVSYTDLTDGPPGSPAATVEMAVVARDDPERLTVYEHADEDDKLVVVRNDERTGYVVDREQLEPLFEPVLAYRDPTVLNITQGALATIDLTRSGEHPAEYHITREAPPSADSEASGPDPGEWDLEGFDEAAVRALIDNLAPLLAEQWLAERPEAPPESVVIELTLADGTMHLVAVDPQSRAATADGVDMAFQVNPSLVDAATAELRDKTVLALGVDRIAEVRVGDLAIQRDPSGRFSMSGGEGELDEQKAATLFNTLAGLTAGYYVDESRAAGDPVATLTLTTTNDQTYTLKLWTPDGGEPLGQVDGDGQAFTLAPETAEKLTVRPVKEEIE